MQKCKMTQIGARYAGALCYERHIKTWGVRKLSSQASKLMSVAMETLFDYMCMLVNSELTTRLQACRLEEFLACCASPYSSQIDSVYCW